MISSVCCDQPPARSVLIENPTIENLAAHVGRTAHPGYVSMMLLSARHHTILDRVTAMEAAGAVVAGLFPGLISEGRHHGTGAVVLTLPVLAQPCVVDLNAPHLPDAFVQTIAQAAQRPTLMVFTSGLSERAGDLVGLLKDRFGSSCTYIGGGAGRFDAPDAACLGAGGALLGPDTAVLIPINAATTVGVRHGWTRTGAPLVATRTAGNVIQHLNWEPASKVYRRAVQQHTGTVIERTSFRTAAASHPLGLVRSWNEDVVRDPLAVTPDGGLICAGPVPQHALLHVLEGHNRALIDAAQEASICAQSHSRTPDMLFVADCVSRASYLNDDFGAELESVSQGWTGGPSSMAGVLTIGEIASTGRGNLEWLNKTCVAASLCCDDGD